MTSTNTKHARKAALTALDEHARFYSEVVRQWNRDLNATANLITRPEWLREESRRNYEALERLNTAIYAAVRGAHRAGVRRSTLERYADQYAHRCPAYDTAISLYYGF
jgi:hypothetical protein